jgi:endoglucanase
MKKILFIVLSSLLIYGACSSASSSGSGPAPVTHKEFLAYVPTVPDRENNDYPLEPMADKTAFRYFADERIIVGWNLGNTFDAYSGDRVGGETNWGNPPPNQTLMNGIKAAGFNIIRIPVTWMGHIGAAPDHRIAESRLKRVAEVVEMAHNAGLKVIINLHHDGSTSSLTKEDGWLSVGKASKNDDENARITHQFVRVWAQIAAYFKNYGDWLFFESMNEIQDGGWGWSPAFKQNPNPQLKIVNEWNQLFTEKVRSTGGNNAVRYLVLPAYNTQHDITLDDKKFKLPADSAADKQVVSFHYYDPYEFGIEGKRSAWGSASDKSKVENDFKPFKPKFIDKEIPVIIGETGAVRQLYPDDKEKEDKARQARLDYLSHIYATAHTYGLVPIYWDNGATSGNGEKFGLFDRNTGVPNSDESRACIEAMINAVK